MTETPALGPARRPLRRRPLLRAAALALVLITVAVPGAALLNRDDHDHADLAFVAAQIQNHEVENALIVDKDQTIEITTTDGGRWRAEWDRAGQAQALVDALQSAQPKGGYTIEVSSGVLWISLVPVIAVIAAAGILLAVLRRNGRLRKNR